jgi:hypothetical protein
MLLTAALLVAALPMAAQTPLTNSAQGSASVLVTPVPILLSHDPTSTLNFGTIPAGVSQSVTTVAPGAANADSFTVSQWNPMEGTFTVALTTTPINLTSTNGGAPCVLTALTSAGPNNVAMVWKITVGGTLTVPALAQSGTYKGNYTLTATYM